VFGFEIKDLIWIILTLRVISNPILKNYDCPHLSLNGIKWILKKDFPPELLCGLTSFL
jgi:hypothetical protein